VLHTTEAHRSKTSRNTLGFLKVRFVEQVAVKESLVPEESLRRGRARALSF
jgi:hypothetical protein